MSAQATKTLAVISDREGFGDAFWRLYFIRALRRGFADHRLVWLSTVPTYYVSVLKPLVAGLLDEVQTNLAIERPAGAALARLRGFPCYTMVIDIRTAWKRVALAWWGLRAERYVTHCVGIPTAQMLQTLIRPRHSLHRLMRLAAIARGRPLDGRGTIAVSEDARAAARALLPDGATPDGATYVGLAPGATLPPKCWPLERFVALGRRLVAAGHRPVVLIGPDELAMVPALRAGLPEAIMPGLEAPGGAAGVPPLDLLLAVGERLSLAVVHDTGPAHMLAALGVPLVSLFGTTDPRRFLPVDVPVFLLTAQEFGGGAPMPLAAVPEGAVWEGVDTLLRRRHDPALRHARLRRIDAAPATA